MHDVKITIYKESKCNEEFSEETYYEGLELIAEEIYMDLKEAILAKHSEMLFKVMILDVWKSFISNDDEDVLNSICMMSDYAEQNSKIKLLAFACKDEFTASFFIECFAEYIEEEYPDETWEAGYEYVKSNCDM